jgi:hypothetical protein
VSNVGYLDYVAEVGYARSRPRTTQNCSRSCSCRRAQASHLPALRLHCICKLGAKRPQLCTDVAGSSLDWCCCTQPPPEAVLSMVAAASPSVASAFDVQWCCTQLLPSQTNVNLRACITPFKRTLQIRLSSDHLPRWISMSMSMSPASIAP